MSSLYFQDSDASSNYASEAELQQWQPTVEPRRARLNALPSADTFDVSNKN